MAEIGDQKIITMEYVQKTCDECANPATKRITFLYENARQNPASKGYRGDDISWCSDAEALSCDDCQNVVRGKKPENMSWAGTFTCYKDGEFTDLAHMVCDWQEIETVHQST